MTDDQSNWDRAYQQATEVYEQMLRNANANYERLEARLAATEAHLASIENRLLFLEGER